MRLFFSACVLVAGLFGYATTRKGTILVGQAGLGAATLIVLWLARGG